MPASGFRGGSAGPTEFRRRIRAHAVGPDDARNGRQYPFGAHQGEVSGSAGGDGDRRARHFGRPASYPGRRLRLPAEAVRTRTVIGDGAAGAGESPTEDGKPRLPDQPGGAGGQPYRSITEGDEQPGALLRHYPRSSWRRARHERRRDRRTLETSHGLYDRYRPRHGIAR